MDDAPVSIYLLESGWVEPSRIDQNIILSHADNVNYLEVDLRHLYSDYPLARETITITEDMLFPYAKTMLNNRRYKGTSKLPPNLNTKKNYTIHYRNLKLYLQLSQIFKIIKFRQMPWFKP